MSISLSIAKSSLELGLPLLLGRDLAFGDSARFPISPTEIGVSDSRHAISERPKD